MILVDLEIENYKQFAGTHRIEVPSQAVVGVVGANGVGKTTLFQAIEWCLYNPREIENVEVPPRGGIGNTRVRVVLRDPGDGVNYVVERILKKSGVSAEIYREDQPETRIVQGTRQVSDYVSRHLIGLSHRAFVSTFFTRQKELTFFGMLKETERRREVGRLLGLETIRAAQQSIGEERTQARAEAAGLRGQHTAESQDRDFAAEAAVAEQEVANRESAVEQANLLVATAAEALLKERAELERWRSLERRDTELAVSIERVTGNERVATTRLNAISAELDRLDEAERSRAQLAPLAASEPDVAAQVAAHQRACDDFARQRVLQANLARAEQAQREATHELQKVVQSIGPSAKAIAGWAWLPEDDGSPISAAERLTKVAAELDVDGACDTAAALAHCQRLMTDRSTALAKRDRYRELLRTLERERDDLCTSGDPYTQVEKARQEREQAIRDAESAAAHAQSTMKRRDQLTRMAASLRGERFEDRCPTCLRPFSAEDAEAAIATFEDLIAELETDAATLRDAERQAKERAKTAERVQQEAQERSRALTVLKGRIEEGGRHVTSAEDDYEHAVRACSEAFAEHGLAQEPSPEQIQAAQARADLFQQVSRARPLLRRLWEDARRAADEEAQANEGLAELGQVDYDEATHQAATDALTKAREAAARIVEIDRNLARRPDLEAERAAASQDAKRLAQERTNLERDRSDVGFDRGRLDQAVAAEEAAQTAERDALDGRNAANGALREAAMERKRLLGEHERITGLIARADARQRQADELERMYREFTAFDQYVAAIVTPQLAEQTSELLNEVTEGKYDRVVFDENYGIEVYDGQDEHFPIEQFSGGERDVIALCARLALSRMVGGQAGHPPGFLVLDEVFGSLDQERRARVLDILGTLSGSADAFQQLFIISHVDDVRGSPIFDEVWRVHETAAGISELENVTHAGGLED